MTESHVFEEEGEGDTLLVRSSWITVKQTKHGFHFVERAGRNSFALFLSILHCIPDQQPLETGTIGLFVGAYPGNVTFSALKVWEL